MSATGLESDDAGPHTEYGKLKRKEYEGELARLTARRARQAAAMGRTQAPESLRRV